MNLELIARALYERWVQEFGSTSDPSWRELQQSSRDAWGRLALVTLNRAREVGLVEPKERTQIGLYNFKPQFVPFILEGTKTHTIRGTRVHGDSAGKPMHLFTGLRHKGARLLMRAPCVRTEFIRIEADHRVRIGASLGDDDCTPYGEGQYHGGFVELDESEKNLLAWRDGFRPPRSTQDRPGEAFALMMQFWEGRLPFEGIIYHWDPAQKFDRLAGSDQRGHHWQDETRLGTARKAGG